MTGSTFLITGGAGFIGSHLTRHLVDAGHRCKVLDNFSSRPVSDLLAVLGSDAGAVEIIEGDICNAADCRKAVEGADYILHHAAIASVPASIARPEECIRTNVTGTVTLLSEAVAANLCRRFVFASSSSVYGDLSPVTKTEDAQWDPLSPYATSKLSGELLCRNYAKIHRLPTVCLRYFNVFGVHQDPGGPYAAVVPMFIEALMQNQEPIIYGDGEQSRDFVSVEDVVQANLLACSAPEENVVGKAFNIGSGQQTSLNQLVDVLGRICSATITPQYRPARAGDILHSLADISLARRRLGYEPSMSLETALRAMLNDRR